MHWLGDSLKQFRFLETACRRVQYKGCRRNCQPALNQLHDKSTTMKSLDITNLTLLLSLCLCRAGSMSVSDKVLEVESSVGEDCVLQCTTKPKPGVQYSAVRWYKVGEPPASRLSGLLTKELPNGTTRWYLGVDREMEMLDESRDIFLPNVTCDDGGLYLCHLAAPVGEQNREEQVLLTVEGCPIEAPTEMLTDTYLVIFATVVLILALVIFLISYGSLKNVLRDRTKTPKKETLLDAPLKPLDQKDLQSIYRLGPKAPKTATMKHIYV
ncbi:CD83 antigen [Centropristis striata]|uniref:CD83 antigen n=1 Tax=Centropristis striata TaxID=184440 RepID=UPI0027E1C2E2|nr:CD83 antigen [Centropristis striata]